MNLRAYPKNTLQSFGIVGLVFSGMILFYPVQHWLNDLMGISPSFLVYYVLAMAAPLYLLHFLKKKEEETVTYLLKPKDIGVVLILVVATVALQWGVTGPIGYSIPMPEMFQKIFRDLAEQLNDGYGLISIAIMAPFFEEFIFRGIMLDGLLKKKSTWTAILISAALFGLVHLNPWQFVTAMIIGTFAGWVYSRTKSLIYCIIIHFANNFTASIFMFLDPDSMAIDEELHKMYGGSTNMYVIVTASIVIAAVCIYVLNKRMKMEVEIETPMLERQEDIVG
ncbi:MAG: membrane protease YdiL (CAAX protease family) [Vicingaceae bacterium]|jgi:membrane protease YdiL (CAAX protease family)